VAPAVKKEDFSSDFDSDDTDITLDFSAFEHR
jgi:hypothetical protein